MDLVQTKVFDEVGDKTDYVTLQPNESVNVALSAPITGISLLPLDLRFEKPLKDGKGVERIGGPLPLGISLYTNTSEKPHDVRVNCVKASPAVTVTFDEIPDDGSLVLDIEVGSDTLSPSIDHDETAADLQAAIRAADIRLKDTLVAGSFELGFVIAFVNCPEFAQITDDSDLEFATNPVTVTIDDYELSGIVTYPSGEKIETVYKNRRGVPVISIDDEGATVFKGAIKHAGVQDINSAEQVTTGASTVTLSGNTYKVEIISGDTGSSENVEMPANPIIGQRVLVVLKKQNNGSDIIAFDDTEFEVTGEVITGVALDAEDEFLLAEFNGTKWQVIYAATGVVTLV